MLRPLVAVVCLCLPVPVWADARITVLMDSMQFDEVVSILHEEGIAHGASLDAEMLGGKGGPVWTEQVRALYDPQRMEAGVRQALSDGLDEAEIERATAFYASEAGSGIVASENQARRAMTDPSIETAARALVNQTRRDNPAVYAMVEDFIEINDLIDNNVSGAMSQQFRFLKGLSDGGLNTKTDTLILDDVWAMQESITVDTKDWLYTYLILAYVALPQEDLDEYVGFSASDAGQALNAALFAGFDEVYRDISYGLGRAVALHATSDEI